MPPGAIPCAPGRGRDGARDAPFAEASWVNFPKGGELLMGVSWAYRLKMVGVENVEK